MIGFSDFKTKRILKRKEEESESSKKKGFVFIFVFLSFCIFWLMKYIYLEQSRRRKIIFIFSFLKKKSLYYKERDIKSFLFLLLVFRYE